MQACQYLAEIEEHMEQIANGLMQNIEILNNESNIYVSFMISEEPEEIEVIMNRLTENIAKLLEMSDVKPTCFFAVDVVSDDMRKGSLYLVIEEQKCYVLYCDANDPELNSLIVDHITQILKQVEIVPEIYFESARHTFFSEAADIFIGVMAMFYINNKENGLSITEIFSLLCYNALPISTTLQQDDGGNPGSRNPELAQGNEGEEGFAEEDIEDDFDEDGFDGDYEGDEQGDNNAGNEANGENDDFDDDDFGGDDFDDIDDLP